MIRRLLRSGAPAGVYPSEAPGDLDTVAATPRYFTDGVNLYRLVCWLRRPAAPHLAELEDCRSLDCTLVSSDDLARLALRAVPVSGAG
jgi:hypothetical protein